MMNDQQQSPLATGTQIGAGIVSWGDYATGYMSAEAEPVYIRSVSNFNVWKDMAEEPWKYGDDIEDWLDLDAELQQAPGRWRLEAFWDAEEKRMAYDRLMGMLRRAFESITFAKTNQRLSFKLCGGGIRFARGVFGAIAVCVWHTMYPQSRRMWDTCVESVGKMDRIQT